MKKKFGMNRDIYAFNFFEQNDILKAYSVFVELINNLSASADIIEPQEGKTFSIRINDDKNLSLDDLENFIEVMELMVSANTISCGLEDEHSI